MNMMRKIYLILSICLGLPTITSAQLSLDDFGRVVLNTYVSPQLEIPDEAKRLLETKLSQIASANGMGGSQANPRFIITAVSNVMSKDIVAGPPQMIALNVELTLFIGDAVTNTIFATHTVPLKGVGTNENKAFIEALKSLNVRNRLVSDLVKEGKEKIIAFYETQCEFLLQQSRSLADRAQFAEAIYELSTIPEVSQGCYFKSLDLASDIFQRKIDTDCAQTLSKAKSIWSAKLNPEGAEEVGQLMEMIHPLSSCQPDVQALLNSIESKLKADEQARWQFKLRQYADRVAAQKEEVRIAEEKSIRDDFYREAQSQRNLELDKLRVSANRDVAMEFARNQPKTVNYNTIRWR
jgi:hypothetical protein